MTYRAVRFPMAPLVAYARPETLLELAELIETSPRSVWRWQATGLTVWTADRVAVALGAHPCEIWPEWWSVPDLEVA